MTSTTIMMPQTPMSLPLPKPPRGSRFAPTKLHGVAIVEQQQIMFQRGADAATYCFKPCPAEMATDPTLAAATVSAEYGAEILAAKNRRARIKQLSRSTHQLKADSSSPSTSPVLKKARRFSRTRKPLLDISNGSKDTKKRSSMKSVANKLRRKSLPKQEENALQAQLQRTNSCDSPIGRSIELDYSEL